MISLLYDDDVIYDDAWQKCIIITSVPNMNLAGIFLPFQIEHGDFQESL